MSTIAESELGPPIFKAVSGSTRQLFHLLNCIRFAPKAQVQITSEGLRFAVEESRVLQGLSRVLMLWSRSNVSRDCVSR